MCAISFFFVFVFLNYNFRLEDDKTGLSRDQVVLFQPKAL